MPKIFITAQADTDPQWGPFAYAFALAEDGVALAEHYSTNKIYSRFDMGLKTKSHPKHKVYAAHYPDGYELVDLVDASDEDLAANIAYRRAIELNHASTEPQDEPGQHTD